MFKRVVTTDKVTPGNVTTTKDGRVTVVEKVTETTVTRNGIPQQVTLVEGRNPKTKAKTVEVATPSRKWGILN
jgi:hypothetical protein